MGITTSNSIENIFHSKRTKVFNIKNMHIQALFKIVSEPFYYYHPLSAAIRAIVLIFTIKAFIHDFFMFEIIRVNAVTTKFKLYRVGITGTCKVPNMKNSLNS